MIAAEADEVLQHFEVIRERLKSGLRRVMEITRKEPHYVAGLVIAAGCEAMGHVLECVDSRKRAPEEVFVQEMVLPGSAFSEAMGRDLFHSLRDGIAHTFETKFIRLDDGRLIQLVVSWGPQHPHLGLRRDPPGIYLNLPVMQERFEAALDRCLDLVRNSSRRGRPLTQRWLNEIDRRAESGSQTGWADFLGGSLSSGSSSGSREEN